MLVLSCRTVFRVVIMCLYSLSQFCCIINMTLRAEHLILASSWLSDLLLSYSFLAIMREKKWCFLLSCILLFSRTSSSRSSRFDSAWLFLSLLLLESLLSISRSLFYVFLRSSRILSRHEYTLFLHSSCSLSSDIHVLSFYVLRHRSSSEDFFLRTLRIYHALAHSMLSRSLLTLSLSICSRISKFFQDWAHSCRVSWSRSSRSSWSLQRNSLFRLSPFSLIISFRKSVIWVESSAEFSYLSRLLFEAASFLLLHNIYSLRVHVLSIDVTAL